ncbi:uncharacterized protein BP5553_03079 [Venustampulla echinocandica]|uniref:Uncharacterized protein n=1 Tax=Venustampulla echinocandica TaxID=2656787 RepID=A0A370TT81_9HELO|nr:uncharacterized protein BP5553_03079 [Venustampulla echinocandica]RDL38739.1 hypothetical protein BP5553_03079 [Venustampulla echinocandica]
MAYDARDRQNMELGKKKIDAMSYGFFNLPFSVDGAEPPTESVNRPEPAEPVDAASPYHDVLGGVGGGGAPLPFVSTLDTGTTGNWISDDALQRLQIKSVAEAPTDWITFNGKTVRSEAVAEITWTGVGNRKTRVTSFRVAKKPPFDVVFGSELIFSEQIFSFDKTAWILARKPATKAEAELMAKCSEEVQRDSKMLEEQHKHRAKSVSGTGVGVSLSIRPRKSDLEVGGRVTVQYFVLGPVRPSSLLNFFPARSRPPAV